MKLLAAIAAGTALYFAAFVLARRYGVTWLFVAAVLVSAVLALK